MQSILFTFLLYIIFIILYYILRRELTRLKEPKARLLYNMQSALIRVKIPSPTSQKEEIENGDDANVDYENGDSYSGGLVSGLRSGEGTYNFKNGDSYTGGFLRGVFEGKGTFTSEAGDMYEGTFVNGTATGQGTATFMSIPDIQTYEGFWRDNIANGKGKLTFDLGDYYEGNFEEGRFHGKGSMFFINGDAFDGVYVNGVPQGDGQMIFKEAKTIQRRRFTNGVDRATTSDLRNNTFDIQKKSNVNIKEYKQTDKSNKFFYPKATKKIDNSSLISGLLKGIGGKVKTRPIKAAQKATKNSKIISKKASNVGKPEGKVKATTRVIKKKDKVAAVVKPKSKAKPKKETVWPEYSKKYPNAQQKTHVNHSKIFNEIDEAPSVKRTKSMQDTINSARSYFMHLERLRAHGFQV